ncbi:sec-independent protein translocase protein TatC [Thermolongibacillus altinsuensis]|uniref:Sec-independent protein translocase protein TatC n=2 Tax=Thermolongibacillus altinsuensis TaxID=575256 RepID=A0A4R1QDM4_9BACL|nr:sec-independent protein translocase protein TatC [Thermolongibacillus altinsuensis]GMB09654.1 sec-independent protein translocase protein TatC [Thermolongibacillus altinsuensis]
MEEKQWHEDQEMTLVEHLNELRKRLIIVAVALIAFFVLGFVFVQDLYRWIVEDLDVKLTILGPTDILWVYFMLAGVFAITLTIPVFVWQTWLFVKPALTPKERKITLSYIPATFILFVLGLCFGYFVVLPIVFRFLVGLGDGMFATMFTTEKYFRFVLHMTLPFAVLFELPVIVMFLTSIGLINPYALQKVRKYAYFVLIVVAVSITPPDFISDFLVTIPLLLLYEISISISKFVYKKRENNT